MASLSDTEVAPGQILAGKFRIERVLGRGGMGVVVAATHIHLDERVAIKFLLPEALQNAEAVKRFEREARAAVKIKSEYVARVTDVGTLETGSPYMVMEYLNGTDLAQYLDHRGPLPIEEAIEYLMQAIEAIAEAHSVGIIHRDLKPANLFRIVRPDGTPAVKVLDFGISKVTAAADSAMTQTSSMMGSPYYMSPEQMTSSRQVDARSDVWALGIILYELLAGRVPFGGDSIPEIVGQVLQSPVPPITNRPDISQALERVILKALAKNRDERYSDVAAFASALAQFGPAQAKVSVQRVSRVLGVGTDFTLPDGTSPRGDRESRVDVNSATTFDGSANTHLGPATMGQPRQSSGKWIGLAVAFVALGGAGAFAWTQFAGKPSSPALAGTVAPAPAAALAPAPVPAPSPAPAPVVAPPRPAAPSSAPEPVEAAQAPASPRPTGRPSQRPRPAPAPAPAPVAAPAPAPEPRPTRPAKPTDLFSDRK